MKYASGTTVSTDRSLAEIRQTLSRFGADKFGLMDGKDQAAIGFEMGGRAIRMVVELPKIEPFLKTDKGRSRTRVAAEAERVKAEKQLWRNLALIVKAKCASVDSGVTTFDTEWLPYFVLKNGRTVAEHIVPQLAEGSTPTLMLGMDP